MVGVSVCLEYVSVCLCAACIRETHREQGLPKSNNILRKYGGELTQSYYSKGSVHIKTKKLEIITRWI